MTAILCIFVILGSLALGGPIGLLAVSVAFGICYAVRS